ncbi:MAG: hypothetical protein JWM18_2120 [Chloroflexi bacterium]|jgi:hypothetical protein|nr:hypothetical protein [Chloroflexota bacterium]
MATPLETADEQVAAGNGRAAINALRDPSLQLPLGAVAESVRRGAMLLHLDVLAKSAGRAASTPESPPALYDFGVTCHQLGIPEIAVQALRRCLELEEHDQTAVTLAATLEDCTLHTVALVVLEGRPHLLREWTLRYVAAFNALMSGDIERARGHQRELSPPGDDAQRTMSERLERMLRRADAMTRIRPLSRSDLQRWEMVISASLITTLSPWAFSSMHGRWGLVGDTYALCRHGLQRLVAVVSALERRPEAVLLVPDRDSTVLGLAAAHVLGVPARPFDGDADGLVVVYDPGNVAKHVLSSLRSHRPRQLLAAHATNWVHPSAIAPDITTLVHQFVQAPWGERTSVDPTTHLTDTVPADPAPAPELAERIVNAAATPAEGDGETPADTEAELVALALACHDITAVAQEEGPRERMWLGGPVRSARFIQ